MRKQITENNLFRKKIADVMLIACVLTVPVYGQMQPAGEQPQAAQIDSALLEKAAEAYLAITRLESSLKAELEGVEDQEKIEKKVSEARARLPDLLAEQGLSETQYQQVMQAASEDQSVRDRFVELINKKQSAGNTPAARNQQGASASQNQQRASASRNQQNASANQSEISAEQLKKTATAYRAIAELNQQTRQKLDSLDSENNPEQVQKIVAEAKQTEAGIIKNVGLTEESFRQTIQQIGNDQALMEKFMTLVKTQE